LPVVVVALLLLLLAPHLWRHFFPIGPLEPLAAAANQRGWLCSVQCSAVQRSAVQG